MYDGCGHGPPPPPRLDELGPFDGWIVTVLPSGALPEGDVPATRPLRTFESLESPTWTLKPACSRILLASLTYAVGAVLKNLAIARGGPDVEVTCAVQLVVMRQPGNALFLMTSDAVAPMWR